MVALTPKGEGHSFDWDTANTKKCQKHGVSIAEVEFLFLGDPTVYPDLKHSETEDRQIATGKNNEGRHVAVVFTYRVRDGTMLIRPISARYMHRKEIKRFEKL